MDILDRVWWKGDFLAMPSEVDVQGLQVFCTQSTFKYSVMIELEE